MTSIYTDYTHDSSFTKNFRFGYEHFCGFLVVVYEARNVNIFFCEKKNREYEHNIILKDAFL